MLPCTYTEIQKYDLFCKSKDVRKILIITRMASGNRARIVDIAKRAGVSIGTVDRVLHNRGEVAKETRERVMRVLQELNYQPDILARTLVTKKLWRFAALIPGSYGRVHFWDEPLEGMKKALSEIAHFGVTLEEYLFDVFDIASFESKAAEVLRSSPDGIILAPFFTRHAIRFVRQCRDLKIPVILINAAIPLKYPLAFIGQDSRQSGRVAAQLFDLMLPEDACIGIVNIAGQIEEQMHIAEREKGFRAYFDADSGFSKKAAESLLIRSTELAVISYNLHQFLSMHPEISGLFVTNSHVGKVAATMQNCKIPVALLGGYDLTPENRRMLEQGKITFLLGQKPGLQGYQGLMNLYYALVMQKKINRMNYVPIDIITRENLPFYE